MKINKIIKKPRIIILLIFLIISISLIHPQLNAKGISIKQIEKDSAAHLAGMSSPSSGLGPTSYEKILKIGGNSVETIQEYYNLISEYQQNDTISIETDKQQYMLIKSNEDIGITVQKTASSNLRLGLELQGGTRVTLEPAEPITDEERDELIQVMETRLNEYGLKDIEIKKADGASSLFGGQEEKYIIIEIAGATKQEVTDIIAAQGVFEAKIGNETVFQGGQEDITRVCRNDGTCSGVSDCNPISNEGYYCEFQFALDLSVNAAQRFADATSDLEIVGDYLSEKIDFYLDEELVDSLNIGSDLKGIRQSQIVISGPGIGETREEAIQTARNQMNRLQTILLTGALSVELEVRDLSTVSPLYGQKFTKNAILIGFLAIVAVSLVIFVRYRNLKILSSVLIALISEVTIILGIVAGMKYNLDLAAIAGLIAAVGTGVDDQIVIIDEVMQGKDNYSYAYKERLKKAFFIIFAAYATTVAAMFPLLTVNAGLLKGFALITIIGVTSGVLITRPAFATLIEKLTEE